MARYFGSRLSRRQVLWLGLGAMAAAAGARLGQNAATDALAAPPPDPSGPRLGEVIQVAGGAVVVRLDKPAQIVTAQMAMFPSGISPRVGDLVSTASGLPMVSSSIPLCAPTAAPLTVVPVATWTNGVPTVRSGHLMIGDLRLVDSPAVLAAAKQGVEVSVHTLDSRLIDHQVLAVRPA
jgi:hypothetical protein